MLKDPETSGQSTKRIHRTCKPEFTIQLVPGSQNLELQKTGGRRRVANMGTDIVALLGVIDGWQNDENGRTHIKHTK